MLPSLEEQEYNYISKFHMCYTPDETFHISGVPSVTTESAQSYSMQVVGLECITGAYIRGRQGICNGHWSLLRQTSYSASFLLQGQGNPLQCGCVRFRCELPAETPPLCKDNHFFQLDSLVFLVELVLTKHSFRTPVTIMPLVSQWYKGNLDAVCPSAGLPN
jgi:hypothetical protein